LFEAGAAEVFEYFAADTAGPHYQDVGLCELVGELMTEEEGGGAVVFHDVFLWRVI
jgi:hypothetical protein